MSPATVLLILMPFLAADAYLTGLGNYGLLDNNEGLYASIALEMLTRGDWVVPHFNGLPYLEKPPLLFWLTAGSFALLGTEAGAEAARLVPALSSLACVAMAVWFGMRNGRMLEGTLAGTILTSSLVANAIGRTLYFDMLLTALLSAALIGAYIGIREDRRGPMALAGALLGLATLAKGFVAPVLGGGVLFAFLIASRAGAAQWRRLFDPAAIAAFLAVAAPWHVAAAAARPEFLQFYFVNEHLGRALGTREPFDYYGGPIWYYVPRLFAYAAPWTVLLPILLFRGRTREPADGWAVFLWTWLAVPFALFSFAGNKANYYMIVAIVPLALLLARRIAAWIEAARSRYLWVLAGVMNGVTLAALIGIDTACGPELGDLYPFCTTVTPSAYAPLALVFAALLAAGIAARGQVWRALLPVLAVAALMLPVRTIVIHALDHYEDLISQRRLAENFAQLDDGRPLYLYSKLSNLSSLAFYLGRPIDIVDNRDADLIPAQALPEATGRFIDLAEFRRRQEAAPLFVIAEPLWLPTLQQGAAGAALCVVQRGRGAAILSNRAADCRPPA